MLCQTTPLTLQVAEAQGKLHEWQLEELCTHTAASEAQAAELTQKVDAASAAAAQHAQQAAELASSRRELAAVRQERDTLAMQLEEHVTALKHAQDGADGHAAHMKTQLQDMHSQVDHLKHDAERQSRLVRELQEALSTRQREQHNAACQLEMRSAELADLQMSSQSCAGLAADRQAVLQNELAELVSSLSAAQSQLRHFEGAHAAQQQELAAARHEHNELAAQAEEQLNAMHALEMRSASEACAACEQQLRLHGEVEQLHMTLSGRDSVIQKLECQVRDLSAAELGARVEAARLGDQLHAEQARAEGLQTLFTCAQAELAAHACDISPQQVLLMPTATALPCHVIEQAWCCDTAMQAHSEAQMQCKARAHEDAGLMQLLAAHFKHTHCVQAQEALEQLKADEKQSWTELLRAEQARVPGLRLQCAGAESSLRDAQHALACQQVRGPGHDVLAWEG